MTIIFDNRWSGQHGIGRFSSELRRRLPGEVIDIHGDEPVSPHSLLSLERQAAMHQRPGAVFFSPGFTPPISWRSSLVFTIHDLIHLDIPEESSRFKTLYYRQVIRPATHRARSVLTVSEYSRQRILEWSGALPERVHVVGNGVDAAFTPEGEQYRPGYPYILYIRNGKPHKNVSGLLSAFALMEQRDVRLVLSGQPDDDIRHEALRLGIDDRVVYAGRIPEEALPAYYRGAAVVTMPSLYEGFGLPALEGMASGVPVVVSNTTSLPEVVGDAGILVDPTSPEDMAAGLSRALTDSQLREQLIKRGLVQAARFKWDDVAARVEQALQLEDS